MYHTEPPTDKTIREWYMNSSRVAACALRNEQAVRACIVGGRRLLITESLPWKDTISGHSGSSTCMLSKHIGKKGDQLCIQMKLTYTVHTEHPMRGMTGGEQD